MFAASKPWMPGLWECIFQHLLEPEPGPEGGIKKTHGACSSKGRIVILGRIVLASGQILRPDFRPHDKIFRPGMAFRPLDE